MSANVGPLRGDAPLRLAVYRPHASIWFKNPVRNILRDQRLPNKYGPLFDHLLASGGKLCLTTSMLPPGGGAKAWIRWLSEPIDLLMWCLLNRIPLWNVRFIFRKRGLRSTDALFLMHYGNLTHESEAVAREGARLAAHLADAQTAKVVHMTHYAYCPTTGAGHLEALHPDLLVAENDLARHSAFYAHHFGRVGAPFRALPYVAAGRFVRTTRFGDRAHKVVATGSITYKMKSPEFVAFFVGDELQPLRRAIYENAARIADQIECLISDLNASRPEVATPAKPSLGRRVVQKLRYRHPQGTYYKKDIVSVYNGFTMFVVPEEICDLPAIGFVEGMACGCAYLGVEGPMYADLGMVAGVHYIAYDGTLDGLVATAKHYQQPAQRVRLESIAEAGRRFVTETLSAERVYAGFVADIRAVASMRRDG